MSLSRTFLLTLLLCVAPAHAGGVPNPTFAEGDSLPAGWMLAGAGDWRDIDGDRAIAVHGDGERTAYWRSEPVSFAAGALYRLRFRARRLSGSSGGGTAMSGTAFANRDLGVLDEEWRRFNSYFVAPADDDRDWLRFGQWRLHGTVAFDDIELRRVQALHRRAGDLHLGEGERIEDGHYTFHAPQRTRMANGSRPLEYHDAGFNSYRWVFGEGQHVTFRHEVGGLAQRDARVRVNVNYHTGGRLLVEASGDREWTRIGEIARVTSATFDVPVALLPSATLRVRLRADGGRAVDTDADPVSFQVDDYGYEAELIGAAPDVSGATRLATVAADSGRVDFRIEDPGDLEPGVGDTVVVVADNPSAHTVDVRMRAVVSGLGESPADSGWLTTTLRPGDGRLRLPYRVTGTGDRVLHVQIEGDATWRAEVDVSVSVLHADDYGESLDAGDGQVDVWWASSGWKVSRTRAAPEARGPALHIEAACNETEAAQLVLRPRRPLAGLRVHPTRLTRPDGAEIPADRIEVLRVGYVDVRQPTDATGEAAPWPDPLLPAAGAQRLAAARNQPFWVRVDVPPATPAGIYEGELRLVAEGYSGRVPMRVTVFDFDLPDRMSCQTALGFSAGELWRYHGVEDEADRRRLLARYLESFGRHHISPYDPAPLDPPRVTWPDLAGRVVTDGQVIEPLIDWTAWDAAMRTAIDEYGFNTFRVRLPGMGGGTYIDRREPELLGYGVDTPQYQALFRGYGRALERHLQEQGWLDEAFVYWFDEPQPRDYEFVMAGFRRLEMAAPRLRRMLTEQVESELIGGPNLWCPVTPSFDAAEAAPRMRAGDEFWWYVCTEPKAPYAGPFIDHAGTELRVWLWQTWQRGIGGILVWATNYWTSGAAYPEGLQNPYEDPMSWESTYNAPVGARRPWGNGDGRFLYPPPETLEGSGSAVLTGPVESIRWEMLRDGIEDYEYLALLRRALAEKGEELGHTERARWTALLEVPPEITESMTRFTKDPAPIEARRREVARALEALAGR